MRLIGRSPSYLVRRSSGYYFRVSVPPDLVDRVGRLEIRIGLRTRLVKEAKERAGVLGGLIRKLFVEVRLKDLNQDDIDDILNIYKYLALNTQAGALIEKPVEAVDKYGELLTRVNRIKADEVVGRSEWAEESLDDILRGLKYPRINKKSVWYQDLLRQAMDLTVRSLEEDLGKLSAEYPQMELERRFNQGKVEASSPTLGQVWKSFRDDKINAKRWKPNSVRRYDSMFDALVASVGDVPVNQITKAAIASYRKDLDESGRDVSTIRGYMQLAKALLDHACNNDHIQTNPVLTGMIPPKKRNEREQVSVFTEDDLARLFDPGPYLKWSAGKPSRFFIPLLALLTGARLEELASLHTKDILTVDDIPCIDINDDGERSVKNDNAIRIIPLHPYLIECGFVDYVQGLSVEGQVFPELRKLHFKFGHKFSRMWMDYQRKKIGITDKRKKFHSFRHTVTDHLYDKMINETVIEELCGRAGRSETSRRYAKGHRVKTLYEEAILKIDLSKSLVAMRFGVYI